MTSELFEFDRPVVDRDGLNLPAPCLPSRGGVPQQQPPAEGRLGHRHGDLRRFTVDEECRLLAPSQDGQMEPGLDRVSPVAIAARASLGVVRAAAKKEAFRPLAQQQRPNARPVDQGENLAIARVGRETVKNTVAELIQVLDDPLLKEPERAEQRRREIERIVRHRVSYEEMAKRALGTRWSEINEHDRQEFVGLFVQLLRDAFASRINEHTDEQIVYLGEQRKDHFAEVRTQLNGQKVDTRINFRLMQVSGDWLVYDVVVDGVSIVRNYRAQFTTIIRDVTYVGLVKKMKQNAFAVKAFEKTTPR